jgi:hypothetical protein
MLRSDLGCALCQLLNRVARAVMGNDSGEFGRASTLEYGTTIWSIQKTVSCAFSPSYSHIIALSACYCLDFFCQCIMMYYVYVVDNASAHRHKPEVVYKITILMFLPSRRIVTGRYVYISYRKADADPKDLVVDDLPVGFGRWILNVSADTSRSVMKPSGFRPM